MPQLFEGEGQRLLGVAALVLVLATLRPLPLGMGDDVLGGLAVELVDETLFMAVSSTVLPKTGGCESYSKISVALSNELIE